MSDKIEGTLLLDGLLEGTLPGPPDAERSLQDWVYFAASAKLQFSLERDGRSFSLLAENTPIQAAALGPKPAERIADALRELLKVFPAEPHPRVFSTLRSIEYRPGSEVQTLYTITEAGEIQTRERTVDTPTTPAPRPLTRQEKLHLAAIGAAVAVVVLLVSSLFVDYGAVFKSIRETVTPLNMDQIQVETGSFRDYFTVEKKAVGRGGKALMLTLRRSETFPRTPFDLRRLAAQVGDSLSARLTLEALARGYVRCECFDQKNEFLGFTLQRIAGLRERDTLQLVLPLPRRRRLARVVITY